MQINEMGFLSLATINPINPTNKVTVTNEYHLIVVTKNYVLVIVFYHGTIATTK